MFWRVLIVIGGLTFLINGCQILGNEDCNSVDLGGTHRVISYSCLRSPSAGEMSGGAAGGLGVAIGLGMILLATWPAIQNVIESRQPSIEPRHRPTTPPPETRGSPPPVGAGWTKCGSLLHDPNVALGLELRELPRS